MTSNNNLMEKGLFFRRVFHLLFALVIIYYLFPKTLFGIPMYIYFIILFFILPLLIETIRLKKGLLFPGLHEHERNHVASYLWFSFGATILILFFPQQIAAPCIVATALGDPVIGMTKPYRRRFMVSITFLICLTVFIIFKYTFFLAIFAAGVTFIAESFEFKIRVRLRPNLFWSRSKKKLSGTQSFFDFLFRTDDDFIMQIIPAVVLYLLFLILPNLAPPQLLHPLPQLLPFT
jgi:dolichol kinase